MNICGVLVHAMPAKIAAVEASLRSLDGVEVHKSAPGGRLIVTVEDTEAASALDTMATIHRLDGIVAASLIYHHFDQHDEPAASGAANEI